MLLLNPIIPFTMDEVNENYPLKSKENVQLYDFPVVTNKYSDKLIEDYNLLKALRADVLKALEDARQEKVIGSSQEAMVYIDINDTRIIDLIDDIDEEELERIFVVSKVVLQEGLKGQELSVSTVLVKKHDGIKCDRCWNYKNNDEITEIEGAHLCPRCQKAMKL